MTVPLSIRVTALVGRVPSLDVASQLDNFALGQRVAFSEDPPDPSWPHVIDADGAPDRTSRLFEQDQLLRVVRELDFTVVGLIGEERPREWRAQGVRIGDGGSLRANHRPFSPTHASAQLLSSGCMAAKGGGKNNDDEGERNDRRDTRSTSLSEPSDRSALVKSTVNWATPRVRLVRRVAARVG